MLISRPQRALLPPLLVAALAGMHRTGAASERTGLALQYEAPATCPDRERFRDAVARRLGHPFAFDHAPSDSVAGVRIATTEEGATAEISFESRGGTANRREFATASCDEAVEAAALVVALIIDPTISTTPTPPAPKPTESGPPPHAPPIAAAKTNTPLSQEYRVAPAPPPRALTHSSFTLGPAVLLELGIAPTALAAAGAHFGFSAQPERRGSWAPHLAVSGLLARTGVVGARAELGSFTLFTSQLDGCSSKWQLSDRLSFRPCLSVQLGGLAARGETGVIARPTSATRMWASAGVLPMVALHVHPLEFALGVGVRAALARYEFVFENPFRRVYQAPIASLSLDFSLRFEP